MFCFRLTSLHLGGVNFGLGAGVKQEHALRYRACGLRRACVRSRPSL